MEYGSNSMLHQATGCEENEIVYIKIDQIS